jgi:polyhydroxyalkanoate synthesis regulator phasin
MPPAKRSTASSSSSASKPAAKKPAAKSSAAKPSATKAAATGAKATATTARTSAAKTATQAKGAATRTARAAKPAADAAKSGAKATATSAKRGAKATTSQAKAATTRTKNAAAESSDGATATRTVRPKQPITLTHERIQATLDDAAARGRVTRKDANEIVAELVRHGQHAGEELGELLGRGAKGLQKATKRVSKAEPVDRIVRGADRARRAAGVGPSFPITGYDALNVSQVNARVKELTKPEARKVLTYERKHANRKSVVSVLEKQIG